MRDQFVEAFLSSAVSLPHQASNRSCLHPHLATYFLCHSLTGIFRFFRCFILFLYISDRHELWADNRTPKSHNFRKGPIVENVVLSSVFSGEVVFRALA